MFRSSYIEGTYTRLANTKAQAGLAGVSPRVSPAVSWTPHLSPTASPDVSANPGSHLQNIRRDKYEDVPSFF